MKRSVLAAVGGVLIGALILDEAMSVRAAGDLQGQELRPARDLESGLEVLIGGLLGGGGAKPAGSIDSVVVTEDAASRLGVAVSCSGSLDGRQVRGELLGADRRPQREFRPALFRLAGDRCEAELSFEPERSPDELPASAYLRVSVDGGGPGLKRVYTLGKAWGAASGDGASMGQAAVKVRARAERLAAGLPATEPAYQPTPAPQPQPQPTPVVGGHWEATKPAVVRDHRRPTPAPVVRDNRGRARAGGFVAKDSAVRMTAAPPPVSAREVQLARARTSRAVQALPQSSRSFVLEAKGLTPEDRSRGASGANLMDQHDLLFDLVTEEGVEFKHSDLTGISGMVFGDKKPESRYFYFLPRTYHLGWLTDQRRYEMSMLYLAATPPTAAGEVQIGATLTAGIDGDAIRVTKALLASYCERNSCGSAPELRPLPIDPGRADVKLGALGLFNIPKDKVVPHGVTDALGDFRLAWSTDAVTKENIQLVLEQSGLGGSVAFGGADQEQVTPEISVEIKLADPGSFARPRWRRSEPWRNPTPYPVRAKYLHALMTRPGSAPTVYSWSLGGATIAPGGRMECDAREVPAWVDGRALRLWVDYAIVPGCRSCTQQVMKDITGGVTSVASSQITFHTINPMAELGAHELAVRVRSRRFDPEGRASSEKSVVLNADNQDFTLGPIYVDGSSGRSEVLFEYFLTVAMADGTEHEARDWVASNDLRVLIGRSQIEKALGFLPGARPDSPGPQ